MSHFPVHTMQTAPAASQPVLRRLNERFGAIPNVAGAMATSPTLIEGFIGLFERVHAGSLSEMQIQTVLLTNAVTNASEWPVAFHTALALSQGVSQEDVDAMRGGNPPRAATLAALSMLARTLIQKRGRLAAADKDRFLEAGFTSAQLLEVIAVVAASTITNYTASVTCLPLEAGLEQFAWHAPAV